MYCSREYQLTSRFIQQYEKSTSNVTNSSSEIVILSLREAIGILDFRYFRYYKIQQGVLQQNLRKFYNFKFAENVCNQFNNLQNALKKEDTIDTGEKYEWLDNMDERNYMSDKEILEMYIDLSNSCLHKEEKEEVMDMLYKV